MTNTANGVDTRPTFTTSARPLCIDPALLALKSDSEILFVCFDGFGGCRASDYINEIKLRMKRQDEGFFTVEEAAQVLADSVPGVVAKAMQEKMLNAFRAHTPPKLRIRDPGDKGLTLNANDVRPYVHLVKIEDVDKWLKEDGMGYQFPKVQPLAGVVALVTVELASDGPVRPTRTKRRTWLDGTETYLVDTFKAEQYPTAKEFYKILLRKAGADSPFDKGVGPNLGSFIARDVCKKVTDKMIQGFVTAIRKTL